MKKCPYNEIHSGKIMKPIRNFDRAIVGGQHIVELTTFASAPNLLYYIYFFEV